MVGGISLSISADSARTNFRMLDRGDGTLVGLLTLLGALVDLGAVKLCSPYALAHHSAGPGTPGADRGQGGGQSGHGGALGAWLVFGLQRAFQLAPKRLLTDRVYGAMLAAVLRMEGGNEMVRMWEAGQRFAHPALLLPLLRCLPSASLHMQLRVLQDLLLLATAHPDNLQSVTAGIPEWPEWLLELLMVHAERAPASLTPQEASDGEVVADMAFRLVALVLEPSMRGREGWKAVEGMLHCLDWVAGRGDRERRMGALAGLKRRLFAKLMDFCAQELLQQTQKQAAAAAGVAAEGLSPQVAREQADSVAQLSMCLAENCLLLLVFVEDFLRHRALDYAATTAKGAQPAEVEGEAEVVGGISLETLRAMADGSGQISAAAMGRVAAAKSVEPYEAVRAAFISYGTCSAELEEGWNKRSRLWFGVGLPQRSGEPLEGGAGGWDAWKGTV